MGFRKDMRSKNIVKFLRIFSWKTLSRMYGSAHSSIIGFISSMWINQSYDNTVFDGAPSSNKRGRPGRKHADILLCKNKKPYVVVEVESGVSKYRDKVYSIQKYQKKFNSLEFGLLIMTNIYDYSKGKKYKHNWGKIENRIKKIKKPIVLISIEKEKMAKDTSLLGCLRDTNDYYPCDVVKVDYRVYSPKQNSEGPLYRKNEK